jgi:hypothetical protein
MKKNKQKKKRLTASEFHGIITNIREYIEQIALLIHKGLITHNKGSDSYHFGILLACIFNVKRANGKRENLKHTAIYEGIKRGKSNLNSEK